MYSEQTQPETPQEPMYAMGRAVRGNLNIMAAVQQRRSGPLDEVQQTHKMLCEVANQMAALTDTLCGACPSTDGEDPTPRPDGLFDTLTYETREMRRVIGTINDNLARIRAAIG